MSETVPVVTQGLLEEWLVKWQKILRIQDWDIVITLKRRKDMNSKNALASCEYALNKHRGTIEVLDPTDWPDTPFTDEDEDVELSVVHECIHFIAAPFFIFEGDERENGEWAHTAQEVMIHRLSKALVTLDRMPVGNQP